MRRTLYTVPSARLATYVRGSARRAEKEIRWALNHGVTDQRLGRILATSLDVLGAPVTRTELAELVARRLGLAVRWESGGGWGSRRKVPCISLGRRYLPAGYLLHLLGARGVVCSGPLREGESTYVRADAWIPQWKDSAAEKAEEDLLRRYLRSFGPATPADFVAWTRMTNRDAQGIWSRVQDDLGRVRVGDWTSFILREDAAELSQPPPRIATVRLLPYFDSYLMGHDQRSHLIDPSRHREVYRDQGWVAPVVLVDGVVRGVWDSRREGAALVLTIRPFTRLDRELRESVRAEADALSRFLDAEESRLRFEPASGPPGPAA